MKFTRIITKTGVKAQGGLDIPSPFILKGEVSGITLQHKGAGWTGGYYTDTESVSAIIIEGTIEDSPRGMRVNVGGLAKNVCSCSKDGLVHTINKSKLLAEVDAEIVAKTGCKLTDIS